MVEDKFMSEESNIYENNNEEPRYTPEPEPVPADDTAYYSESAADNNVYAGEPVNYGSGKGQGTGFGIASMICGIVSLIGCCGLWYVSIPCAIAAIVLGIVQIVKNESKGMAVAGIVCGAIGLLLTIVVIILVAIFVQSGVYHEIMEEMMRTY